MLSPTLPKILVFFVKKTIILSSKWQLIYIINSNIHIIHQLLQIVLILNSLYLPFSVRLLDNLKVLKNRMLIR